MLVRRTAEMIDGFQDEPVIVKPCGLVVGGYIYYFIAHCLNIPTLNCEVLP